MPSKEHHVKELPLNGQLRTADDPVTIGPSDFCQLTNLRYGTAYPKGIGGMSKINDVALENPVITNGIHFRREFPVNESHVIVSAVDSNGENRKCYRNDAIIPGKGEFESEPLFVDDPDAGEGRFSLAPDGVAYANGKDAALWLGDEAPAAGFINYDPDGSFRFDWSDAVSNSLRDNENTATLHAVSRDPEADPNLSLLLHLNNNLSDSSGNGMFTTNGNVGFVFADGPFGGPQAWVAEFNGTSYIYLSFWSNNPAFDFSGGNFTVDTWIKPTITTHNKIIYFQCLSYYDISSYIAIVASSQFGVNLRVCENDILTVDMFSPSGVLAPDQWNHIAVTQNGDNYYIFVNGNLVASANTPNRIPVMGGLVYIGNAPNHFFDINPSLGPFVGRMSEFRVSRVTRWTSNFEPPSVPYGNNSVISTYVRSLLPLSGISLYMSEPNTANSYVSVSEWTGSGWSAVSNINDGTSVSGVALAQSGKITFDSTANTSKLQFIDGIQGYWYRLDIIGEAGYEIGDTIKVYMVSISAPMQQISDIWDGSYQPPASFQRVSGTTYDDFTVNVFENLYDYNNSATYVTLNSLSSSDGYVLVGFHERVTAVNVSILPDAGNTAPAILSADYWNGREWIALDAINDGTSKNNISFATSGFVSWDSPGENIEHRLKISASKSAATLYYYRLKWSNTLSSNVRVFYAGGVIAPRDMRGYAFPFYHLNRLCFGNKVGQVPNEIICSVPNTSHLFSGPDIINIPIGDMKPLVGAASVYSRFGSALNTIAILFKDSECWSMIGTTHEELRVHQLSANIGLCAPLTVKVVPTYESQQGIGRAIAIWQGSVGIYMSDGASLTRISDDIRDKFDPLHKNYLGAHVLPTCSAYYDGINEEYHWIIPDVGEYAFDLRKNKWFEVDRGKADNIVDMPTVNKKLQAGIEAVDIHGNPYPYGTLDSGYLERLEHGTTFDGLPIKYKLRTADMALHEGSIWKDTTVRKVKIVQVAKGLPPGQSIPQLSYIGNTSVEEAKPYSALAVDAVGTRLSFAPPNDIRMGPNLFHGLLLEHETTDVPAPGFEPIFIGIYYETTDDQVRR